MYSRIVNTKSLNCREKRLDRISEALRMERGTFENQKKHVIYTLPDGAEAYFLKPGKEAKRLKKINPNDMLPFVDGMEKKYSFADVWGSLCKLRNAISLDSYKKLSVILYRLAYLLDCTDEKGKVRFAPDESIIKEINGIQEEVNAKRLDIDVMALICFIDLLGWNEDVKYHPFSSLSEADTEACYAGLKERTGRINTILTCISVPISFQNYTENVIGNADNPLNIDFSLGLNIAQTLTNRRGIYTLTNGELIKFHSPYLTD